MKCKECKELDTDSDAHELCALCAFDAHMSDDDETSLNSVFVTLMMRQLERYAKLKRVTLSNEMTNDCIRERVEELLESIDDYE